MNRKQTNTFEYFVAFCMLRTKVFFYGFGLLLLLSLSLSLSLSLCVCVCARFCVRVCLKLDRCYIFILKTKDYLIPKSNSNCINTISDYCRDNTVITP